MAFVRGGKFIDEAPARGGFDTVYFARFRFDRRAGLLWRDDTVIPLRPKTADVLRCLVASRGEVVTKQELLETVWPEGFVGDAAIAVCINEIRRVLGDDAQHPQFIETVHRRGYRFVARVSAAPPVTGRSSTLFVGRDAELALLEEWWRAARAGDRQLAFIAAEAGVGKTALVDAFVERLVERDEVMVGRGQCVEQYEGGEPYLPFLESLAGLCRGPDGEHARSVLHQYAPTWLLQVPGLVDEGDVDTLRRRAAGAPSERMLRELADALEVLGATRPILLVCADLHAADRSTIELLSYLARRRPPPRLLGLGTYRPAEAVVRSHPVRPLVQDLRGRQLCHFLALELLAPSAVEAYVVERLAPRRPSPELIADLTERTDGNAMFLVTVVDYLVTHDLLHTVGGEVRCRDALSRVGIPESVGQLINRQLEEFEPTDRLLLEIASAVGREFTTEAVLAGADGEGEAIAALEAEARFDRLARDTALLSETDDVEWPGGSITSQYRFRHAMYQETLYERLGAKRRATLHRNVGERLEAAFGSSASVGAAELAHHFERGYDFTRAVQYLAIAAETALQTSAHRDAHAYVDRAFELLERDPSAQPRAMDELRLRMIEGSVWITAKGFSAPEVGRAYSMAQTLCHDVDDASLLVPVQAGLWNFTLTRGALDEASALADRLCALAERDPDPAFRLIADNSRGQSDLFCGAPAAARPHIERVLGEYDESTHGMMAIVYGEDAGVIAHLAAGIVEWLLGFPDRARAHVDAGLRLARRLAFPAGIVQALWHTTLVYQFCGDTERVHDLHQELARTCQTYDLPMWAPGGAILDGWATARTGDPRRGFAQIRAGLADWEAAGAELTRPYNLALLAECAAGSGDPAAALDALTTALAAIERTGERWYEAEIVRLRADVQRQAAERAGEVGGPGVEGSLLDAIEIARRQDARSLELRAVVSLARLWQAEGAIDRGRDLVAETLGWFTEGHDTADLRAAEALLAELAGARPLVEKYKNS